jgi:hypothetical protein
MPTPKAEWTAWDDLDIRELALDELQSPSGAYDGPINRAGHQFDHLFRNAGSPPEGTNDMRSRNYTDQAFARRNGNNNNGSLDPRGDQENGPPSAEECASFVQMLLQGLAASDAENETDEHNKLMEMIAALRPRKAEGLSPLGR